MEAIEPQGGPSPSGAYAAGVRAGGFVFVSGQGPLDPVTGEIVGETIEDQVDATLANVERVLQAAGCALSDIVRTDVYLADFDEFDRYDRAYRARLGGHLPARTTVAAGIVDIKIEINAIAVTGES
jgi:2-iminobutanoate/2-iminopropanoate deaminase